LIVVSIPLILLASIVFPGPGACHPHKPPEARAYGEIKTCELAITKLMTHADVTHLRELFSDPEAFDAATPEETLAMHTGAIYALLRDGKNASLDLRPEIRNRLGSTYMDLTSDPWGEHPYVFYMPYADGDEANALDRRFLDTYMTYRVLGGETKPWQSKPPVFIACRGKDGRLELLESHSLTDHDIGDDFSNLRDPSAPGRIESLGKPAPSR